MRSYLVPVALSLLVTSASIFAPGDILSAVVTIEQVYLQAEAGEADPEDGRTTLSDEQVTVDLLTLQNDVLAIVEGEEVPTGTYNQLRLVISGGFLEVEDEDGSSTIYASSESYAVAQGVEAEGRLRMPSYATSGLKVVLPGDLGDVEGGEHAVLLDFDVAESFGQQAGNSGTWVMRPVVRATNFTFTGTAALTLAVSDGVDLPDDVTLAEFSALLDKDGELMGAPFADGDGDGVYSVEFVNLPPDTYSVDLIVPEGVAVETNVSLPLDVLVQSGITGEVDVVITSAE